MVSFSPFLSLLFISLPFISVVADIPPLATLAPPYNSFDSRFASSVSTSNGFALIGDSQVGIGTGISTIWHFDSINWNSIAIITPPDSFSGGFFGYSVSLIMPRALISSPDHSVITIPTAGLAYIFEPTQNISQWINITQLVPSDPIPSGRVGDKVALSLDHAVISAPYNSYGSCYSCGATYVFNINNGGSNNWGFVTKLVASDPNNYDYFGSSVAINGDNILVGAVNGDDTLIDVGTAYLFGRNVGGNDIWGQIVRLVSPNSMINGHFGVSVAISNNFVLIGSSNASFSGAVYSYQKNYKTWIYSQTIVLPMGQNGDNFGATMAINDDKIFRKLTVAIGSPNVQNDKGAVYVLQLDGTKWKPVTLINDYPGATSFSLFGWSIGIDENFVIIGAPFFNFTGKAYIMKIGPNIGLIILIIIVGAMSVISGLIGLIVAKIKSKGDQKGKNIVANKDISANKSISVNNRKASIKNNTSNRRNSINSTATETSNASVYSEVRRIPLSDNISIKSGDLDLYNPKVIKEM